MELYLRHTYKAVLTFEDGATMEMILAASSNYEAEEMLKELCKSLGATGRIENADIIPGVVVKGSYSGIKAV